MKLFRWCKDRCSPSSRRAWSSSLQLVKNFKLVLVKLLLVKLLLVKLIFDFWSINFGQVYFWSLVKLLLANILLTKLKPRLKKLKSLLTKLKPLLTKLKSFLFTWSWGQRDEAGWRTVDDGADGQSVGGFPPGKMKQMILLVFRPFKAFLTFFGLVRPFYAATFKRM